MSLHKFGPPLPPRATAPLYGTIMTPARAQMTQRKENTGSVAEKVGGARSSSWSASARRGYSDSSRRQASPNRRATQGIASSDRSRDGAAASRARRSSFYQLSKAPPARSYATRRSGSAEATARPTAETTLVGALAAEFGERWLPGATRSQRDWKEPSSPSRPVSTKVDVLQSTPLRELADRYKQVVRKTASPPETKPDDGHDKDAGLKGKRGTEQHIAKVSSDGSSLTFTITLAPSARTGPATSLGAINLRGGEVLSTAPTTAAAPTVETATSSMAGAVGKESGRGVPWSSAAAPSTDPSHQEYFLGPARSLRERRHPVDSDAVTSVLPPPPSQRASSSLSSVRETASERQDRSGDHWSLGESSLQEKEDLQLYGAVPYQRLLLSPSQSVGSYTDPSQPLLRDAPPPASSPRILSVRARKQPGLERYNSQCSGVRAFFHHWRTFASAQRAKGAVLQTFEEHRHLSVLRLALSHWFRSTGQATIQELGWLLLMERRRLRQEREIVLAWRCEGPIARHYARKLSRCVLEAWGAHQEAQASGHWSPLSAVVVASLAAGLYARSWRGWRAAVARQATLDHASATVDIARGTALALRVWRAWRGAMERRATLDHACATVDIARRTSLALRVWIRKSHSYCLWSSLF